MKKMVGCLILFVAVFCLYGCQNEKDVDIGQLSDELSNLSGFPEMQQVGRNDIGEYFDINADDVKELVAKVSSDNMRAEEIILIQAVSDDKAKEIVSSLEDHLKSQKNSYKNYNPAEYSKIKDVKVNRKGSYVYYVVGPSKSDTDKVLAKYFSHPA